jgi:hypothetical protein
MRFGTGDVEQIADHILQLLDNRQQFNDDVPLPFTAVSRGLR